MGPPLPGDPTDRTPSITLWQDGSEHATDLVLPFHVHLLRDGSPARQQQAVCAIAEVGLLPENRPLVAEANGIPSLSALLTLGVVGTPEMERLCAEVFSTIPEPSARAQPAAY